MTTHAFNLNVVHPTWLPILELALSKLDANYVNQLSHSKNWLPGPEKIFSAFSIPIHSVNYVLFGESPYPRPHSANGYAFWDAAVQNLWSETGLDKKVNRATSLRNILKMLLIAEGLLDQQHHGQADIAKLDKSYLVQTNQEFFENFLAHGFLLLNATLVLQEGSPQKDAKAWEPFVTTVIEHLVAKNPKVQFILFGQIANKIERLIQATSIQKICVEHPYNHSFITNSCILDFFGPLHLLRKSEYERKQA